MVIAMERVCAQELHNVFFVDGDVAQLPLFFAPGEVDRIYINFCDPWPSNRHAKRRLTHGNFLRLYRQVLKMGGQIHFKTDNQDLFTFSVEELPLFGFELSEVTRDLHANGPVGVMTDYEAKFHEQGLPICRCVATMVPWEEPFPTDIRRVKNRWLDVFADGVSDAELGRQCGRMGITCGISSPGTWCPACAATRPGRLCRRHPVRNTSFIMKSRRRVSLWCGR